MNNGSHIDVPDKLHNYSPLSVWDPKEALSKIQELYASSLKIADDTIAWYRKYRRRKGGWARILRILAIVLMILSTLMPYMSSTNKDWQLTFLYVGYIMAATGAGFMILDRFYGFSSSWIRFVLTGMDLENLRNQFVEKWQIQLMKNVPLTKESFCLLVDTISTFRSGFEATAKAETVLWAKENIQSMSELSRELKLKSEELKAMLDKRLQETSGTANDNILSSTDEIPEEIFAEAIRENAGKWKEEYNVSGVGLGRKVRDGNRMKIRCLVFYVEKKLEKGVSDFKPIPLQIEFKGHQLPTDVISLGGKVMASSFPALLCDNAADKRPGCSVSRVVVNNRTGTIGLKVFKNGKEHIMSCYHVFCQPEIAIGLKEFDLSKSNGSAVIESPSSQDEPDPSRRKALGTVTQGILNTEIDGAIAILHKEFTPFHARLCSLGISINGPRDITMDEIDLPLAISAVGRTSGVMAGVVLHAKVNIDVSYLIKGVLTTMFMQNMICAKLPANGGDSGCPVVDHDSKIIGILFATATEEGLAYIVPINRLLNHFQVTLNP
ncbi:MAG: SLATT domain-containing protein [Bacteroidetes bacterium]|nr:SLATT domain-containing protein [Bacteroidota bacterium]